MHFFQFATKHDALQRVPRNDLLADGSYMSIFKRRNVQAAVQVYGLN